MRPMRSSWHRRDAKASKILSRLMASMPAATFEMETFARLADVVASTEVPTAAMECKHRPRLLINPDFVQQHCIRDEHLFLLVMHELWHVMLAHTSLYPRVTQAQNIAFDAIINAGLMRKFSKPSYMGFFDKINPPDQFPHLLLRPPVGWPDAPQYPDHLGPPGTGRIMRQLYPEPSASATVMPFYDEILALIMQDMAEKGLLIAMPTLLGDHESEDPYKSKYLQDAMGRAAQEWPIKVGDFGPSGQGGQLDDWRVNANDATRQMRHQFSQVLRRCFSPNLGDYRRKQRQPIAGMVGMGVVPNGRDRLIHARKALGSPSTLWAQQGTYKARVPERRVRAHVYLDVSGSMSNVLPHLVGLITPYVQSGQAEVFQFSTLVEQLPLRDLSKGLVRTTGGTRIQCVMEHIVEHTDTVKRALILTDGYTGRPRTQHVQHIKNEGKLIHVVLPHESPNDRDLRSIATSFTILPPIH